MSSFDIRRFHYVACLDNIVRSDDENVCDIELLQHALHLTRMIME
jgi:hypothetical protein